MSIRYSCAPGAPPSSPISRGLGHIDNSGVAANQPSLFRPHYIPSLPSSSSSSSYLKHLISSSSCARSITTMLDRSRRSRRGKKKQGPKMERFDGEGFDVPTRAVKNERPDDEVEEEKEVKVMKEKAEEEEGEEEADKTEKKAERVHPIAGGLTDGELEAFYREVHRKLRANYPASWLLVTPKQEAQQRRADEKKKKRKEQEEKEEEEMSEQEEQEELDKEEQEMEVVESLEQREKKKNQQQQNKRTRGSIAVEPSATPSPRRNPQRRSKKAKIDIKIEKEEKESEGDEREKDASAQSGKEQKKTNVCGGQKTVLASVISTVLSQNTTDRNSSAAWANLRRAYKDDWERARTAKLSDLADVIRTGGLAQRKGAIIQGLLNQLHKERGELSLEHLRELATEEVKQKLTQYKGIGPKTASCVLMFNMKRADFPVDTHVHRVSTRLGFVRGTTREQTYEFMNATMPDEIKRDMHVLLIHGKQICNARSPKCGQCFLLDDCRYGQTLQKEEKLGIKQENEDREDATSAVRKRQRGTNKKAKAKAKRQSLSDDDDFEIARRPKKPKRVSTGESGKSLQSRRANKPLRQPASALLDDIEDVARPASQERSQ